MPEPSPLFAPARIALVSCSVFEKEAAELAAGSGHIVETVNLEIALHDRPEILRTKLQRELDRIDARDDIGAIVLAYGLCGRGTDGLVAGRHPLVIARAHDCITHFLGSKERYSEFQARCPEAYFFTPGWNRARRVPGPERLEWMKADLSTRFDPEDVEYLLEMERSVWASRNLAVYLDLGTTDAEAEAAYAEGCAKWLGWAFERPARDTRLFHDLIFGPWDAARFQIVPPGQVLRFSCGPEIFKAEERP